MSSSLDKLVENLSNKAIKYTEQEFSVEEFTLMKKKGVNPYDFMDSFEKFDKRELPKKEDFFTLLRNENITEEQTFAVKNNGRLL